MPWISKYNTWLSEEESLNNANMVIAHLYGKLGWSKNAVSAICGNMRHESSINPDIHEFGYGDDPSRGYGLVQWTPKTKLTEWAASVGQNHQIGETQLNRIQYESENNIQYYPTSSYPESFLEFQKSTKSLSYLTNAFCWNYERPLQSAGEASMPSRIAFAQLVFDNGDWSGGGGGTDPEPPSGSNGEGQEILCSWCAQTNCTKETCKMIYKVKSGDSLSVIAQKTGTSMNSIERLMFVTINDKNSLQVGEYLYIPHKTESTPSERIYVVKSGDTLSDIGQKLGVSWQNIAQKNGIKAPAYTIYVGQRLKY